MLEAACTSTDNEHSMSWTTNLQCEKRWKIIKCLQLQSTVLSFLGAVYHLNKTETNLSSSLAKHSSTALIHYGLTHRAIRMKKQTHENPTEFILISSMTEEPMKTFIFLESDLRPETEAGFLSQ